MTTPTTIRVNGIPILADTILSVRLESCHESINHSVSVSYVHNGRETRVAKFETQYVAVAFREYRRIDDEWYHAKLRASNSKPVNNVEPAEFYETGPAYLTSQTLY
jgi:hypothetical protein